MNKSKRRCGFLLILWALFTANLSKKVELFPKGLKTQKEVKVEAVPKNRDTLYFPREIHTLPESAHHYTAVDAK